MNKNTERESDIILFVQLLFNKVWLEDNITWTWEHHPVLIVSKFSVVNNKIVPTGPHNSAHPEEAGAFPPWVEGH